MRALTLWSRETCAGTRRRATRRRKSRSWDTSSSTLTSPLTSPRRVHTVMPPGVGSPDMTPCEKRPPRASGVCASASGARTPAAAAVPAAATNWRRVCTGLLLERGAAARAHYSRRGTPRRRCVSRSQRDVAVLALRPRLALGQQRLEGRDHLRARLVRDYHVVDVAALGRRVRVGEARPVVVDQLLAARVGRGRLGDVAAIDDVHRALRAHDRDL